MAVKSALQADSQVPKESIKESIKESTPSFYAIDNPGEGRKPMQAVGNLMNRDFDLDVAPVVRAAEAAGILYSGSLREVAKRSMSKYFRERPFNGGLSSSF